MTVTTILNGKIKIVLTPENEVDKIVLAQFRSGEVFVERGSDNYIVANKPMPDSLILSNEKKD